LDQALHNELVDLIDAIKTTRSPARARELGEELAVRVADRTKADEAADDRVKQERSTD
jgi:hypothetical protein